MLFLVVISYPLYLMHQYIGEAQKKLMPTIDNNSTVILLVIFADAMSLAYLIHITIEKASTKLLKKYYQGFNKNNR
tara:strand:- start:533 stop:760 length:228 start_codon:yes stop_codon:yes gene_type:complete